MWFEYYDNWRIKNTESLTFTINFLIAEVTVSLQQTMQSVDEDVGSVVICVDLVGATLARSVTITLTPQPGTACKFSTLKHHVFSMLKYFVVSSQH